MFKDPEVFNINFVINFYNKTNTKSKFFVPTQSITASIFMGTVEKYFKISSFESFL